MPEEIPLLRRLGLGVLDTTEYESPAGRNDNRVGVTSEGHAVFVKRLDPTRPDALARFRRAVRFETDVAERGGAAVEVAAHAVSGVIEDGARRSSRRGAPASPRCLGWDEDELTVVFEWLREARSGADLAKEGAFGDELAHEAGRVVGSVHSLPLATPQGTPEDLPPLPPMDFFEALPMAYYTRASGASLEAWGLLQNDGELIEGLRELRREESGAVRTPAHCDLRLDQFLLYEDVLHLCDWEEFRIADPARDIGSFVGEWLHRAVLDIPSQDPGMSGPAPQLSHREVVDRGVRELERLRPKNVAFWEGYRKEASPSDPGLRVRAAAFAGWHLLDRVFAAAEQRPKLNAVDRAAAGIGRSAVLRPATFAATLGLED